MIFSSFRKRATRSPVVLVVAVMFLTTGCAHPMVVKNISLYKPMMVSSLPADIKVGLVAASTVPEEDRLILATVNALKRDGLKVTYPFFLSEENRQMVDYVVKLTTASQYHGSGWNFFITWPGFLLWTPAWHGYNYRALYHFDVDITDTKTNREFPRISAPVDLDIRHADMNRTWTEAGGWFFWTAPAFIGGLIFTRYDRSVTPLLLDATEGKIGDYVASKIEATLTSRQTSALQEYWRALLSKVQRKAS